MKKYENNNYDYVWTTNRGYYNKLRKLRLANDADIHCSYCGYNRGENSKIKRYEIYPDGDGNKYPSWKLVSKNRKQWMEKPYHTEEDYDLVWSGWSGNVIPYKNIPWIDVRNPANFE